MKSFKVKNIISYLLRNSPEKKLPISRLTTIMFLIDWKHCLEYGKKIENLNWKAYSFGPYSEDLELLLKKERDFTLSSDDSLIETNRGRSSVVTISQEEKYCCDFIIDISANKDTDQLVNFMLSLYPVLTSTKDGGQINLLEKSTEYNLLQPNR